MQPDQEQRIVVALETIAAALSYFVQARKAKEPAAPAVDLDSAHGDPIVKAKDPKYWTGAPMQGCRFSECPPEYLDLLAARYDYFARETVEALNNTFASEDERAKAQKNLKYSTLDAARARGWSERLRSGWTRPVSDTEPKW